MPTATLTSKGQITIPVDVRRKLNLGPGSKVEFIPDADGWYRMVPKARSILGMIGSIAYEGAPISVADMDKAIADEVANEYERGL